MNNTEYIRLSLELHLFFDRIMKEHSLFLEAAFLEKDQELKNIAREFQTTFTNILNQAIYLANNNITTNTLNSGEIVTKNTLNAENQTSRLSGIPIDTNLTQKELSLQAGTITSAPELLITISNLNNQTLPIVQNLIKFKNDILNSVLSCKLYTTNYPLLITHIMNEAKMYQDLLSQVERKRNFTQSDLYEQELFWNNIMKEHAEFIRGLLDPSERNLILTADKYAADYKKIIQTYQNNPSALTNASLTETLKFRDFKVTGEEGILNCKIKSIIIPLLADHVVREANHFIRILKTTNL